MEIRISSANSADSMLTHEDGRVRVVQDVARQMWNFCKDLPGNVGVPWRRHEDM